MDEGELWLIKKETGNREEDFPDSSSFTMDLTYQGTPGGACPSPEAF
ncbi:hypothetical protein ABHI18_005168 [Aspergillus niger]